MPDYKKGQAIQNTSNPTTTVKVYNHRHEEMKNAVDLMRTNMLQGVDIVIEEGLKALHEQGRIS